MAWDGATFSVCLFFEFIRQPSPFGCQQQQLASRLIGVGKDCSLGSLLRFLTARLTIQVIQHRQPLTCSSAQTVRRKPGSMAVYECFMPQAKFRNDVSVGRLSG